MQFFFTNQVNLIVMGEEAEGKLWQIDGLFEKYAVGLHAHNQAVTQPIFRNHSTITKRDPKSPALCYSPGSLITCGPCLMDEHAMSPKFGSNL